MATIGKPVARQPRSLYRRRMTLPRYERLPGSPDEVVFRAHGPTRMELFEHAAEAMFSVGRDLGVIPSTYSRPLVAPGDTFEELLVNWLEELLHLGDVEAMVWSSCMVDRLEVGGVQGSASGQPASTVAPAGPTVIAVAGLGTDIVALPEGWWVDVAFVVDGGLRVV